MQVDSELYLNGPLHLFLSVLQYLSHQFRKWEDVVLQYTSEGDNLAVAPFVKAVIDALVNGVVCRGNPLQCSVLLGLANWYFDEIKAIVDTHLSCFLRAFGPQSQEVRLCVAKSNLHLAHLQDLIRMCRADAQARTTIHDVFSKTHCQRDCTLFGLLFANGVIVDATCHTADDGVEAAVVLLAYHLLQNDCHLLLVDDIAGGLHIVLTAPVEDTGINGLDGFGEHRETLVAVVCCRYHIGTIYTCEGLVVRILEQAAGTDGDRAIYHVEEGFHITHESHGQAGTEEELQNLFVGCVAQCHLVEVVRVHELVENVRTEHDSLGDADCDALLLVQVGMASQDVVDEGQATSLTAQAAITYTGEVAVLVEAFSLEDCHNALVLHAAIGHDSIQDDGSVSIYILQALPGDALQELRDGEEGTTGKPTAHIVVGDMVEQAARGQRHDVVL